jgi:hypothetical protein
MHTPQSPVLSASRRPGTGSGYIAFIRSMQPVTGANRLARVWAKLALPMFAAALCLVATPAGAESWSGTAGGMKIEIAARSDSSGSRSFIVYTGNVATPLELSNCGWVDKGRGTVLVCTDDANNDLNNYKGPKEAISVASYYNLRFSSNGRDYSCIAATPSSPMFCRIKGSGATGGFGDSAFKLESVGYFH